MWTQEKIKELVAQLKSFLMTQDEMVPIVRAAYKEMNKQKETK